MTFRRILIAGGAFLVVLLVIVQIQKSGIPSPVAPPPGSAQPIGKSDPGVGTEVSRQILTAVPASRDVEGQPALTPPSFSELSTTDRSPLANLLGARDTKPEAEPKIVLDMLKTYRRLFGAYPAGEGNRQFVNALLGVNKEKLPLLPHDHPRINAQGEIVDAWGTPFFFHQNSRTSVEVRSAGGDRAFFTEDDIVAGQSPATLGESLISEEDLDDR